ncbi:MAG: hypothetical protein VKM17_02130 [Cyanobacteriota bacterium]|nr:hypothetical protein [Cyanobacteriota bacterium]
MEPSATLTADQLDDLQLFLKDWLRHTGRTQADLRRALRASSIRMPVLVDVLQRIHSQQVLRGLAEQLCQIETLWHCEDTEVVPLAEPSTGLGLPDAMDQLDLLLDEIRGATESPPSSFFPLQDEPD